MLSCPCNSARTFLTGNAQAVKARLGKGLRWFDYGASEEAQVLTLPGFYPPTPCGPGEGRTGLMCLGHWRCPELPPL